MAAIKISPSGIAFIKTWEGCFLQAYRCPANVWTIGVGKTTGVTPGMKITQLQAEEFLRQDLAKFENAIASLIKVPLTQNQVDSVISFAFNVGVNALAGSTLLRELNKKNYISAANEFTKWCHGGGKVIEGLMRRRIAEKKLFLT